MQINFRKLVAVAAIIWSVGLSMICAQEKQAIPPVPRKSASKPKPAVTGNTVPSSDSPGSETADDIEKLLTVPENASSVELNALIGKLVRHKVNIKFTPDQRAHLKKVAEALLEATKRILEAPDVNEFQAGAGLIYYVDALNMKRRLGEQGIDELELQVAQKYAQDKRPFVAKWGKNILIAASLRTAHKLKPEDQERLLDDIIARKQREIPVPALAGMAIELARILEVSGNLPLAAKTYEKFAKIIASSGKPEQIEGAEKFRGAARRLMLPGNPIEIEGELLGGIPLKWSDYSGKVVLIDFWWSYSTPWAEELPNIKQNYAAFHEKGFEVLGINEGEDTVRIKSFMKTNDIPWKTLANPEGKPKMVNPLTIKYGAWEYPCTILVGKDGKVLALDVTGEKLNKLLKEQLGDPVSSKGKAGRDN